MKGIIRIGDKTTHGGTVTAGSSTMKFGGIGVARLGDPVSCPQHRDTVISEGHATFCDNGIPVAEQGWQEGQRTVLLYGGSLHAQSDESRLAAWRKLRRSRPLDGVVWAVTQAQSSQPSWMNDGLRTLEAVGETLRYQPSVYLWQVCESDWPQDERVSQPVGAVFAPRATPESIEHQLRSLIPTLSTTR